MIKRPSGNYQDRDYEGTWYPCLICGRPIRSENPKMVRLWSGGGTIVTTEEAEKLLAEDNEKWAPGDMYYYPVGPECLRKHPELKPYAS